MAKSSLLQEAFLSALCKQRALVAIYLTNGIKLQGRLEAFDATSLKLTHTVTQIVYKHAISTISELHGSQEIISK